MEPTWNHHDAFAPTWVPETSDVGGHTPRPMGIAAVVPTSPAHEIVAGRYRVVRRLGSGGCGDVHLAIDEGVLSRRVALKRLPYVLQGDPRSTERFACEARMAVRVRHPNIVTVYDYDLDASGAPFIVMEYVPGPTLAGLSARPLGLRQIAAIGLQTCHALDALHGAGIVHRDIKPSNLMVRVEEGRTVVKLVDFGLARPIRGPFASSDGAEAICGTPQYMAPEQIMGAAVDARTDLFGLGCVLYELLTGEPPGGRAARQLILTRQMYTVPPPLAARGVQVPPYLEQALRDALAKEPDHRPDSVHPLQAALAAVLVAESPTHDNPRRSL